MIEMSEEMKLVKPSIEYLDSYLGCLRRGVDPIRYRESETPLTNEIEEISNDVTKFFKQNFNITGGGELLKMEDGTFVERLPSITWWLWDGEFCGRIQFRWQHNTVELPPYCLGHIGYGVVPWKRNKGYAKKALQLMLNEIKYCGLPYVELTTDIENEVSQKVILKCGGQLIGDYDKLPSNGGGKGKRFKIFLA
jgi:predicted acetyltransferase